MQPRNWIGPATMLALLFSSAPGACATPPLLASTNRGELVRIDLAAGTATLVGVATVPPGRAADWGWSDIAIDANANLFGVSRSVKEIDDGHCVGFFADGPCAHLYTVNPDNGEIIQEIGSLDVAFVSDIRFSDDGTLFGNRFLDAEEFGQGGLITIDPLSGLVDLPPSTLFGQGLENGGIAVHPVSGAIWGVESRFSGTESIFTVDPVTGLAMNIVPLGLGGEPTGFGFDALAILPDGRFFGTRGQSSELYEINPIADPATGFADVTLVPLSFDMSLSGSLNGLTVVPEPSTLALAGCGCAVLAAFGWQRRKRIELGVVVMRLSTLIIGSALWMACANAATAIIIQGTGEEEGSNSFPFGGSNVPDHPSDRYQQVYSASAFGAPINIAAIGFFFDNDLEGNFASGTYNFELSVTSKAVDGLDTDNLDNNVTGAVHSFAASIFSGGPASSFQVSGAPFLYNPVQGNLLLGCVS